MKKIIFLLSLLLLMSFSWKETVKKSKNTTVRFALWGGSENINKWIDNFVAKKVKELYGIKLVRVPLSDTEFAIKKLLKDKKRKRKDGPIDLLWVNGENFKVMKNNDLTFKSYLQNLPNIKYIDLKNSSIANDFGEPIDNKETPWGSAQMVFIYNKDKVKKPPKDFDAFKKWIKSNPGRFTYPSPPDFTGSAFLRLMLMHSNDFDEYSALASGKSHNIDQLTKKLWQFLSSIKSSLYKEGQIYPESISKVHQLYSDELIWITFDYYPTTAQRMIEKGVFPKNTGTFILGNKTLANTHYTSIPFNASNVEGAMVVSNFLISPLAQISKQDLSNWGDLNVLSLSSLSETQKKKLKKLKMGKATLSFKELNDSKVSELPAKYIPIIEKKWKKSIGK